MCISLLMEGIFKCLYKSNLIKKKKKNTLLTILNLVSHDCGVLTVMTKTGKHKQLVKSKHY